MAAALSDPEAEAVALFAQEEPRLLAQLAAGVAAASDSTEDLGIPSTFAGILQEDAHVIPPQLTQREVARIHDEEAAACARDASPPTPASLHRKRHTALASALASLDAAHATLAEERLALELCLQRQERIAPTLAAWTKSQRQKLEQMQQAAADPCAIIGIDADGDCADLPALECRIKRLARQNAELAHEGLMKSLNACHALEMLQTSLRYQERWRTDSAHTADVERRRCEDEQAVALAAAKEEQATLESLQDATQRLATAKNMTQLTQRRLLGAAPLPDGRYIDDGEARVLLQAVKHDLARGSLRVLALLGESDDWGAVCALVAEPAVLAGNVATVAQTPVPQRGAGGLPPQSPASPYSVDDMVDRHQRAACTLRSVSPRRGKDGRATTATHTTHAREAFPTPSVTPSAVGGGSPSPVPEPAGRVPVPVPVPVPAAGSTRGVGGGLGTVRPRSASPSLDADTGGIDGVINIVAAVQQARTGEPSPVDTTAAAAGFAEAELMMLRRQQQQAAPATTSAPRRSPSPALSAPPRSSSVGSAAMVSDTREFHPGMEREVSPPPAPPLHQPRPAGVASHVDPQAVRDCSASMEHRQRSQSAEHARIQELQEAAQRQLEGVAATLRGMVRGHGDAVG